MFLCLNLGMSEYAEIEIFLKFPQSRYAKCKKVFGPNLFFVNNGVMVNYVFVAKCRRAGIRQNQNISEILSHSLGKK